MNREEEEAAMERIREQQKRQRELYAIAVYDKKIITVYDTPNFEGRPQPRIRFDYEAPRVLIHDINGLQYHINDDYDALHQELYIRITDRRYRGIGTDYADNVIHLDNISAYQVSSGNVLGYVICDETIPGITYLRYVVYLKTWSDDEIYRSPNFDIPNTAVTPLNFNLKFLESDPKYYVLPEEQLPAIKERMMRVLELARTLTNTDQYRTGFPSSPVIESNPDLYNTLINTDRATEMNKVYKIDDCVMVKYKEILPTKTDAGRKINQVNIVLMKLTGGEVISDSIDLLQFDSVWVDDNYQAISPEDVMYIEDEYLHSNRDIQYDGSSYLRTPIGLVNKDGQKLILIRFDEAIDALLTREGYNPNSYYRDRQLSNAAPRTIGEEYNLLLDQLEVLVPHFGYLDSTIVDYILNGRDMIELTLKRQIR